MICWLLNLHQNVLQKLLQNTQIMCSWFVYNATLDRRTDTVFEKTSKMSHWTLTLKMVKITLAGYIKFLARKSRLFLIFKHHDLSIKNVNRFWWICIIMPSIKISSYLRCGILLQGLWLYNCVLLSAVLMMLLATQGRTLRATKEINSITRWIFVLQLRWSLT